MLFRSALATSEQKCVENMLCARITLSEKSNQRLHLLLCSLCATCWSEIILVTCVENNYWDLPSSGPARCAQDTRRVLHDKPSRPKVLGDRTQGRHGNPFVRCGAPHRTSGAQKGGAMGSCKSWVLEPNPVAQRQAEKVIRMHMRQHLLSNNIRQYVWNLHQYLRNTLHHRRACNMFRR